MSDPAPIARRPGRRLAVVLGALAYAASLAWLALQPPAHDVNSVRERIAELGRRPAAPVEPLPLLRTVENSELAMSRDPMR